MRDVMGGDLADHDVGRGARDVRQIVMLGDPIARVAQRIGVTREIEAVVQGLRGRRGRGHRRKIENGKRRHGHPYFARQRNSDPPELCAIEAPRRGLVGDRDDQI